MPSYEKVRWGILGCGNIARKFAEGLKAVDDAELVACGSRTQDNADAFGEQFDVPRRHAGYDALAADKGVDAIYVATPHVLHKDNTMLCLKHGKAVLCEKPFAINAAQAREAIDLARSKKRFLMEAMWTRFLPVMCKVRELLSDGAVGDVRMVTADFAFRAGWNPEGRLLNPALGGGGLLDVGVYTISFAHMVLGRPTKITGAAEIGQTGVDEQAAMVLSYDTGHIALLACGVRTGTPHNACIFGTEGSIHIPAFWHATELTLTRYGEDPKLIKPEFQGNGYNYQVEEVHRCLHEGKTESTVMPLDETIAVMETMDALRAQWGLKYPME